MPIITKPRQIRIDIDPDSGFPTQVSIESRRWVEENGVNVADLPTHIENIPANDPKAKKALGDTASAATAALAVYQQETQRLGKKVKDLEDAAAANGKAKA